MSSNARNTVKESFNTEDMANRFCALIRKVKMKKILINASNLHVGGGVQVAASFITELSQILKEQKINADCSVIVSTSVKEVLVVKSFIVLFCFF